MAVFDIRDSSADRTAQPGYPARRFWQDACGPGTPSSKGSTGTGGDRGIGSTGTADPGGTAGFGGRTDATGTSSGRTITGNTGEGGDKG